jgi:hypothetical protein
MLKSISSTTSSTGFKDLISSAIDKYLERIKVPLIPMYDGLIKDFQTSTIQRIKEKLNINSENPRCPDIEIEQECLDRGIFSDLKDDLKTKISEISNTAGQIIENPLNKFMELAEPEILNVLVMKHAGLSQTCADITVNSIKGYLFSSISSRDVGTSFLNESKEIIGSLFSAFGKSNDRAAEGSESNGIMKVISDKLMVGFRSVESDYRMSIHNEFTQIEQHLWEGLPDNVQMPLEKIFGGNPFNKENVDQSNSPISQLQRIILEKVGVEIRSAHELLLDKMVKETNQTLKSQITQYIPAFVGK